MQPEMNNIFLWGAIAGIGGAVFFFIVFKCNFGFFNHNLEKKYPSFKSGGDGIVLGIAERFFFVFATCFTYPGFPLLWVGLKVGVQSKSWTEGKEGNERERLNAYLIMNLISVAIGYLCAWAVFGFEDPSTIIGRFKN
jgi:hypothetical protein